MDEGATAHERVYRRLRRKILHGELAPGQAVTLRGVAAELGVSMTPVREAVRRLAAEGALAISASGRVSAPVLTPQRVEELAAIRALLEPELAARALPRAHFSLIERLKRMDAEIDDMLENGDAAGYVRANIEFHRTLYLRAHAPAMLAVAETVWLQMGPSMRALYGRIGMGRVMDYHRKAIAALAAGDEAGLRLAIRADVRQGLTLLSSEGLDAA
ncbi:GntR family transcriptional regulator [Oceanicella actignis]|uniref:DNA-binding transcriptional regulator, GntR family n=1 Tax=Oceanicella actignis TaxID=1189325 RepID=A0A1M7TEH7_9RHOB|nr:GntR family transcriptional regulator [Oceanicella actignis]TYO88587.1 DNA-binding GntR family transcriptional regulator [Oceanicella actignis]SET62268.1 transcriptional regulator, GntR family [Oceanicella actignis]SHN69125.1 DNA-binding transcriptional regulator, GntR family [Oceanicella actignis]